MSTIILERKDWRVIKEKIKERHGENIFLVSWRLKRELGFTVRTHSEWVACGPSLRTGNEHLFEKKETIRLDFYDGAAETLFRLTYL